VFALTRRAKVPALEKISVQVDWVVNDLRRRDEDNLAPMMKACFDAIGSDRGLSARIVDDDDPAHMVKPSARIIHDPDCIPHFRITITDLGTAE
jgi:hypothetical protein